MTNRKTDSTGVESFLPVGAPALDRRRLIANQQDNRDSTAIILKERKVERKGVIAFK